jgi:ATP/maltotriose-dependent transcriptional regulator MalT
MTESMDERMRAHERFSAECFNSAWDLIDKSDRSPTEDEEMLRLSMASCWHWTQRPDCTDQTRSIAYWQISRIHAILGRADEARRYGKLSLEAAGGVDVAPFALAYAYEALARAEGVAGNVSERGRHLGEAQEVLERITDADTRQMLSDDLASVS